ncbi:MAG: hypothetical protein Q7R39_19755 [Dehalococcoidia bacterium]|nr:hypothetical protein [Dehalococcoidia bacterium]
MWTFEPRAGPLGAPPVIPADLQTIYANLTVALDALEQLDLMMLDQFPIGLGPYRSSMEKLIMRAKEQLRKSPTRSVRNLLWEFCDVINNRLMRVSALEVRWREDLKEIIDLLDEGLMDLHLWDLQARVK